MNLFAFCSKDRWCMNMIRIFEHQYPSSLGTFTQFFNDNYILKKFKD